MGAIIAMDIAIIFVVHLCSYCSHKCITHGVFTIIAMKIILYTLYVTRINCVVKEQVVKLQGKMLQSLKNSVTD